MGIGRRIILFHREFVVSEVNCIIITRKHNGGASVLVQHFTPNMVLQAIMHLISGVWQYLEMTMSPFYYIPTHLLKALELEKSFLTLYLHWSSSQTSEIGRIGLIILILNYTDWCDCIYIYRVFGGPYTTQLLLVTKLAMKALFNNPRGEQKITCLWGLFKFQQTISRKRSKIFSSLRYTDII